MDWACQYEIREPNLTIDDPGFLAIERYDTVILRCIDRTPGWRRLLYEATKATKKNAFLHFECAKPSLTGPPAAYQALSPVYWRTQFKPLGLDMISFEYTDDRQSYWLQRMDEVFPI